MATRGIVVGLCVALAASAAADPVGVASQCPDEPTEFATVAEIALPLALVLADGRTVQLAGVESARATESAPTRPQAVRDRLRAQLVHETVGIALMASSGRWGAASVVVFTDAGDLARLLLERGDVRFRPDRAAHGCREQFLAAEDRARATQAGVWSDAALRPLEAGSDVAEGAHPGARVEGLAIVEGVVVSVGETNTRVYINLGRSRGGFAISVPKRDIALMRSDAITKARIVGTRVRVRGLVDQDSGLRQSSGSRIDVSDADAIEILSAGGGSAPPAR